MCYLLAIGVTGAPWRLAAAFEAEASPEVELAEAPAPLCAAFPPLDVVRVVRLRQCSCDLLTGSKSVSRHASHVGLTAGLRRALLRGAAEMGPLRCYVSSGAAASPFAPPAQSLPHAELSAAAPELPLDSLVEVR